MTDTAWIGQAIQAVVTGGAGYLVAKRSGAATEKTAETSLQVKAYEMVATELKRVQERSDRIEADMRDKMDTLRQEVGKLNERVLALEVEKANLLTEHSRKEREWNTCEGGLNERIHDLSIENERLNNANAQLRDNQGRFVEFIQTHIDTTYNETNFDILQIGDVEIDRRHKHTDVFRESMDRTDPRASKEKDTT